MTLPDGRQVSLGDYDPQRGAWRFVYHTTAGTRYVGMIFGDAWIDRETVREIVAQLNEFDRADH